MKINNILTTLLLCFLIISCTNKKKSMEQEKEIFKWGGDTTTPYMYPIMLLPSIFVFDEYSPNGYSYIDRINFQRGRWGEIGSPRGATSQLPHILDITWLSWVEKKVYTGSFELPVEKMNKLFREGYRDYLNRPAKYQYIIAGIAPEGVIILWVWGNMSCVEVARFQAVEKKDVTIKNISTTTDAKSIKELCDAIMEDEHDIIEYVSKHGLNNHIWDTYRQRFKIRPVVDYALKGKGITDHINIKYLNGEFECLNYELLQENPYRNRARMEMIEVFYSIGQDMFILELYFDEEEIMQTFQKIYGNDPTQEVEFVITLLPVNRVLKLAFRKKVENRIEEVVLKKCKIEMFKLGEDYRKNFRVFNSNK